MNSTKKMIDRLYKDGDNCSFEQKTLRFLMWARYLRETFFDNIYKLSSKESELLKRVTQ